MMTIHRMMLKTHLLLTTDVHVPSIATVKPAGPFIGGRGLDPTSTSR
jgi:hypothetical protein